MKRISHYKTYNPHQFIYDKIELSEDFPTDKPDEECFRELLERIEAMAKVAYPWLYDIQVNPEYAHLLKEEPKWHTYGGVQVKASPLIMTPQEVPVPEQKPLLQLIQESKTVSELKSWELLIKVEKDKGKRKELSEAYDKMLDALLAANYKSTP
jgi:hypothetical protein